MTETVLEQSLSEADLVVGAVLVPGDEAPRVLRREHLGLMNTGSVLVDVAIDQGGCFETSRPTTHAAPTFNVDGISHYCVANIPGAVARTATQALNNATLPYVQRLAEQGVDAAIRSDPGLLAGVNVYGGQVAHPAVAHATGNDYRPFK
jgi:alanine dehydrogenase